MDDSEDNDSSYRRSLWPMLLISGAVLLCIVLTVIVVRRSGDQPVSLSDNGFSFTKVDSDRPQAIEPATGRRWEGPGIQSGSSLKMVDPRSDESIFSSVAPGPGGARPLDPPPPPLAQQPRQPPPEDATKLTPGEEKVLEKTLGRWDTATATQLASNPGLIPSVAAKLLPYPRIVKVLLNNQLLVNTFMKSGPVQWLCSDKKNMVSFLSDGKSGKGVGPWAHILTNASRYPGATEAIMNTAGASTFIRQCGPVMQVSGDQNAMIDIMTKNPQLANVLPTFMQGLSQNSDAQRLYMDMTKIQGALATVKQ